MPYASLPPATRATRLALADARWGAMLAARPDLAPAVALQRTLIGRVFELTDSFEGGRIPRLSLPHRYLTTKLRSGIPALTGEPLQLPVDAIAPALIDLSRSLAEGGGGAATQDILRAMEEGRLDVGALLALTLRREQGALRAFATKAGLGHDLLWLVLDLAVSPFAHALLNALFGMMPGESPLRAALDQWARGYCPLCGSWPTLVEELNGVRRLRCSFCAAAWDLQGRACLFCGDSGDKLATLAPDPSRPRRTVDLCGACRGYSKTVDTDASLPFPLVALADLESMDLDLAAMQHGCARPAIKQFPRR
ncbi:MAG: formate dehydrogenase accessory protein FdhE [Vicinamibacterales bacterium]